MLTDTQIKDAVQGYIDRVLSGDEGAGHLERRAVERHVHDLKHGPKRGLVFDEAKACKVVKFFGLLKHSKGEWAGKSFELSPWQMFRHWCVFGWHRSDGCRRFVTAYNEVARKNGKTTDAAGTGLYLFLADREPGAEIYSAAPLALTTPIPTPTGWTTMADIRVGDMVFNEQGQPTRVTYVSPVMRDRQCYALTMHDGSCIVADGEHRWATRAVQVGSLAGLSKGEWRERAVRKSVEISTTEDIRDTLKTSWGATNHAIDVCGALELPEADLPIAPYTLGVWLGDGRANGGQMVSHPSDREVMDHIGRDGYETSVFGKNDGGGLLRYTILGLRTRLRECGLLNNKHVPQEYLRASARQRADLLCGLMDTDGTCTTTGECRFTNRNDRLAVAVQELAVSLGLLANRRTKLVAGQPHHIVSFRSPKSQPVFRLRRKWLRQLDSVTPRANRRYITSVDPVESVPVRCIGVNSPSHLYLVGEGMVATHNTKREQAKLSHDEAVRMVKASASLTKHVTITRDNLSNLSTNSKYVPLGRDADSTDGLNPHGVIIDELHAHKSRDMLDVLDTATGARRSPLLYIITTAGYDRNSVCYEQREHAERVLDGFDKKGGIKDDTFFAFVACIDDGDDWRDENNWRKANPNLGVSCKLEDLRRKANRAKVTPAALNKFLRLHMGVWTEQSTRWLPMDKWDECALPVDEAALRGRPCYAGLDLATSRDLTALVLAFPDDDGSFDLLLRCWCPRENAEQRERVDRAPYITWAREGLMTLTDGDVTDYDVVRHDINAIGEQFHIKELAVDRLFQGAQLSTQLQDDGFNVVSHGMGFMSMAGPSAEFERMVVGCRLRHGGNPILRWAASNAVVSQDPAGNIKPDKSKANEKIDPIVAAIMAVGRAMATREEPSRKLKRGLVVI